MVVLDSELLVNIKKLKQKLKSKKEYIATMKGGSMRPFLFSGDKLLIKKVRFKDLRKGDVVVFTEDIPLLFIHRIMKISKDSIITKGDDRSHLDRRPIKSKEILGKLVEIKNKNIDLEKARWKIKNKIFYYVTYIIFFLNNVRERVIKHRQSFL